MVRYWVVRMTTKSEDDLEDWKIAKSNNFVGIAWSDMGETLNLKYDVKTVKTRDVADGGVDFVSLNDRGHIKYKGQIKRTSKNISNSEILQLRGILSEYEEGIFITTSHFTPSSIEESNSANKKKFI